MIKRVYIPDNLKKKLKDKKFIPLQIREKFFWCLDMLLKNPQHPSLRHKPIQGTANIWEFSITMNYRCVYRKEKNEAYIILVAKHEDTF